MVPAPGPGGGFAHDSALAPRDSFDLLLYRAVRRSTPVTLSLAVHAVAVLAALWLTPASAAPGLRDGALAVGSVAPVSLEDEGHGADEAAPGPPAPRDLPAPTDILALPDDEPSPRTAEPATDVLPRTGPVVDFADAIRVGPKRAAPAAKTAGPTFDGNPSFGGEEAATANREAAGMLRQGLGGGDSGDGALLRRLDPRKVHVCEGCYDHVEEVFRLLEVRHDTLTVDEIAAAPLSADALLVIDCGAEVLSPEAAAAVRDFVERGGYLCTTDWGLENVLEPAFPGVLRAVRKGGRAVGTGDEVVPFRLVAKDHPLVRGMRVASEGGAWWLENQAHPIEVTDAGRATVLAESPRMRERYGSGVLAVTFPWGKGEVLHLLGHAWQKEGNLKGTYGIQRLILNFLLDRARTAGDAAAAAKGK